MTRFVPDSVSTKFAEQPGLDAAASRIVPNFGEPVHSIVA